MRESTGVDGVMIGRSALGNPWLFAACKAALNGDCYQEPTEAERKAMALTHCERAFLKTGKRGLIALRGQIGHYLKGMPEASRLRSLVNEAETLEKLREILT